MQGPNYSVGVVITQTYETKRARLRGLTRARVLLRSVSSRLALETGGCSQEKGRDEEVLRGSASAQHRGRPLHRALQGTRCLPPSKGEDN